MSNGNDDSDDLIDQTMPAGQWKFGEAETSVFDNMLERSIPQYRIMRKSVYDLGVRFCPDRQPAVIIDLGCSRGGALADFVDRGHANHFHVGVEISQPMIIAARKRFGDAPNVEINVLDLRHQYPSERPSWLTLCILTLQFTPMEYRQNILRRAYDNLRPGGAFILVEKIIGNSAGLDDLFVDIYYHLKHNHQYTQEQIAAKRKSLEGALVPMTAGWNEDLLARTGFSEIDCFWRWMNFAGWVAVK